ncbi:hypothetical protein C7E25_25485, partial [Stenotrophomonas maltophilia]
MASGPCVRADRRLILQLEHSMSRLPSLYISHGSPMASGPCVRADRRLILQLEHSMSRLPSLYISHG